MFATLEDTVTAIVCLITAVVIHRIYVKEKKARVQPQDVKGIMWFGLAIFIWGLGALIELFAVLAMGWPPNHKLLIFLGVLVSLLNSMFILLSLPSIEHSSDRNIVIRIVERFSEREFYFIFGGIMLMLAFVFLATSFGVSGMSNSLIWLIDIPISLVVAFALLNELNKAFANRKMKFMYLPSFGLFVLIVIAVTHRIIPEELIPQAIPMSSWALLGTVTAISFKFLFILLFSILLYSWKFLSEKEAQQSVLSRISKRNETLELSNSKLQLANDSHLDTISRLKEEVTELRAATQANLSDRQKEVLANLGVCGEAKSYTEIAQAMHISLDGFQAHIHQIKKVLHIQGTEGKTRLIQYARDNDLLRFATIENEK
ncbi:helix-turn-helix domain-containing protein [Poritiphilus flavus]|uniref:HTH luxR-type domain-containing protein n=1 Tax=Poritiphilus flavus TaxID=2697053 RepID=A0A6L9E991_9FLAO|nr:hypothetical protein [Poritiphilus flavus]NAS11182.1 hypothetical protein [Poritiphilus flavus]